MRTNLLFNSIKFLVASADDEAFRDHCSVDLVEFRDHLPQSHAALVKCVLGNDALHMR